MDVNISILIIGNRYICSQGLCMGKGHLSSIYEHESSSLYSFIFIYLFVKTGPHCAALADLKLK